MQSREEVYRFVVAKCMITKEINTFTAVVFVGSDSYHLVDNQQIGYHVCCEVAVICDQKF